jgi:ABC-type transport system involved in cytochrome bd biosynthesis fused ATPase/permease subunit
MARTSVYSRTTRESTDISFDPAQSYIEMKMCTNCCPRHRLYEIVGMMPQNLYIFNSTIMDNLRFAKLDAIDKEIKEACLMSGLYKIIMSRSDKYNAATGENGQ